MLGLAVIGMETNTYILYFFDSLWYEYVLTDCIVNVI